MCVCVCAYYRLHLYAVCASHNATGFFLSRQFTSIFFFLNFILNQRCTLADLISRPQFSCSLPGLNIIFTVRDRRDKRLGIFLIPNLKIQQLPDLLSRHGAFNQHKLDHSPQFNKTLLQGLPYDNNRAFRSFVAESAQSP